MIRNSCGRNLKDCRLFLQECDTYIIVQVKCVLDILYSFTNLNLINLSLRLCQDLYPRAMPGDT